MTSYSICMENAKNLNLNEQIAHWYFMGDSIDKIVNNAMSFGIPMRDIIYAVGYYWRLTPDHAAIVIDNRVLWVNEVNEYLAKINKKLQ